MWPIQYLKFCVKMSIPNVECGFHELKIRFAFCTNTFASKIDQKNVEMLNGKNLES